MKVVSVTVSLHYPRNWQYYIMNIKVGKMVDRSLVLCDLLSFIANILVTFTLKVSLRSARPIMGFYSADALADAKVRLFNDVRNMNLSTKHPHVPLRRYGERCMEHEAGDLLS